MVQAGPMLEMDRRRVTVILGFRTSEVAEVVEATMVLPQSDAVVPVGPGWSWYGRMQASFRQKGAKSDLPMVAGYGCFVLAD